MSCGWAGRVGRVGRVDLASGRCWIESLPDDLRSGWLGGRGLGVALLKEFAGLDPCADQLPLVMAGGPLCGSDTPMSSRCVLTGRSPLTGTIFSCSSGGPFAWQLRQAGLDALVITGSSATPVQLRVMPDRIDLLAADDLWGLPTDTVFARLTDAGAVAAIGPAGENGVLYASLETAAGEPFGRGGLGAVVGQRRLKAITIQGDEGKVTIADQTAFAAARQDMQRLLLASPFIYGPFGIHQYGTVALVDPLAQRGMLPARNFTAVLPAAGLNAAALQHAYHPSGYGCYDCPVACKRLTEDGQPLPDHDDLLALAGCCQQPQLDALVAAGRCCAQLGLDPVSAAGSLAAWSELTASPIVCGQMPALLSRIARREAEGELLALGAERLACALGQPEAAMTVKGLELPPYDPRAATGLALAYAVAPHGGTHLDAWSLSSEVLRKPVPTDPACFDGKARVIALAEAANAAMDSLVLCRFAACAVELEEAAALLTAVSGERHTAGDLLTIGERIIAAERSFNQANGFSVADDRLPERFFSQATGMTKPLDREHFAEELQRYQRIRSGVQA